MNRSMHENIIWGLMVVVMLMFGLTLMVNKNVFDVTKLGNKDTVLMWYAVVGSVCTAGLMGAFGTLDSMHPK